MRIETLAHARRFSLDAVQRSTVLREEGLEAELWCFEAGQRLEVGAPGAARTYQVLEGEALLQSEDERLRVGKGRLASLAPREAHALENAGGGLLVVLVTLAT